MEQIIIIGLLIIIIVLLLDKKYEPGSNFQKTLKEQVRPSSLMGSIKKGERRELPTDADQSQSSPTISNPDNFDSETNREFDHQRSQSKELDEILARNNVWEEEEEDWQYREDSVIESGFATGVTFQELSAARQLLQQEKLEPALERQAVSIIQKIEGTELFNLLENSLEDAALKITILLDRGDSRTGDMDSDRPEGIKGFDIGEFV